MHHSYVKYLKDIFTELKATARTVTRKAGLVPPFEGAIPHHNNYGKPLDITWVTKEEHARIHKEMRAIPYWQLLAMAGVPYLTEEEFHEQNRTFHQRSTRSSRYEGHHFRWRRRQTRFLGASA